MKIDLTSNEINILCTALNTSINVHRKAFLSGKFNNKKISENARKSFGVVLEKHKKLYEFFVKCSNLKD